MGVFSPDTMALKSTLLLGLYLLVGIVLETRHPLILTTHASPPAIPYEPRIVRPAAQTTSPGLVLAMPAVLNLSTNVASIQ